MVLKDATKSQWVIDAKVFVRPSFLTEYQAKIGDQAPDFVYRRMRGPPKNKSHGLQEGAVPYPTNLGFHTTYKNDFIPDKSTLAAGYQKRVPFQQKEVQVKLDNGEGMIYKKPVSHDQFTEQDMRISNVRNKRQEIMPTAGIPITQIAPYNIVPGVGPEGPGSRYVFDAFQAHSNKFRDTRKFAKMNNPDIPTGHILNLLTGAVETRKVPPTVEINPRGPARPPLFSLGQVRPPTASGSTRGLTQTSRQNMAFQMRRGGGVAEALGFGS